VKLIRITAACRVSFYFFYFRHDKREYPKVSGLAAWREKCKWYSSLPQVAIVLLFYESV